MRPASKLSSRRARRFEQTVLPFAKQEERSVVIPDRSGKRAIEDESFPFEIISDVAETEYRRKEWRR